MDGDRGRDGTGGGALGDGPPGCGGTTLLVGGSVIALVGQHGGTGGPRHRTEPVAGRTGAGLVLCCLQDLVLRLPAADGLYGLLAASWGHGWPSFWARSCCLS